MIYIISFLCIVILFSILYYRKKNKKNKEKYILDFIDKINNYVDKQKKEKIILEEKKINTINDMGNVKAYIYDDYSPINTNYEIGINNKLNNQYIEI